MSAMTVTDKGETAREAVLREMQEAAENAAGKKGVPKGPQGTKDKRDCDIIKWYIMDPRCQETEEDMDGGRRR